MKLLHNRKGTKKTMKQITQNVTLIWKMNVSFLNIYIMFCTLPQKYQWVISNKTHFLNFYFSEVFFFFFVQLDDLFTSTSVNAERCTCSFLGVIAEITCLAVIECKNDQSVTIKKSIKKIS